MPFYGRERFDPGLILSQIIILQAAFYVSFTGLLLCFDWVLGVNAPVSAQVFDYRALTLREFGGWVTTSAMLIADVPTAFTYALLVGRSKRCLDFACTLFIAHMFATALHSGMPKSFSWWALNAASVLILVMVSEALCVRIEMQEIETSASSFSMGSRKSQSQSRLEETESGEQSSQPKKGKKQEVEGDLEDPLLERTKGKE